MQQPSALRQPTQNDIIREILERDFKEFIIYFFWIQNGLKFQWNSHHDELVAALMRCYQHKVKRLVINIPPRYSKTEIVVVMFVAWCLAKSPKCQFIHLSSADTLALDNSSRIKELMALDEYQELWPVTLKKETQAKELWRTVEGGGLKAGAAGGIVTGFGAGVAYTQPGVPVEDTDPEQVPFGGAILIDDALKPDDAESELERKNVNRRINGTIKSRCNAPWTPIILIGQRLHDDDPPGFCLNGGTGEIWEHLKIPVIKPNGDPLWPFRHQIADLIAIQVADKYVWNAQYMQEPIAEGGDYFLAEKARWYKTLPANLNFYGASDYGAEDKSDSDYTEHGIFGICPDGNIYVTDWWSGQTKSDIWVEEQIDLIAKYKPLLWAGETGPIKSSIEPWLMKRMRERKTYVALRWLAHNAPNYKKVMARTFQALWEAGRIYLPEGQEWAQDLLRQLTRFPMGTLDDKVDTCSLFARLMGMVWEQDPPKPPDAPVEIINVPIRLKDFYAPKSSEW